MGKLEKLIKDVPQKIKKITPGQIWSGLLHLYCTAMITIGMINGGIVTENLFNPTKVKYINVQELKKDVKKSIDSWKNKEYSLQDYYKNQNENKVPYSFQDYLEK